jgi:3-oxoacyl-[acyl-carrier protein] reductase
MSKLQRKVALITGSGRGIGRALALKLASEGASIVINDLDEEPALEVVERIKEMGGRAVSCVGSVTSEGFADRFINLGLEAFGGLDILVNNAGYTWDSVVQKMTDEQFQTMLDVHLVAPFRVLRAAAEPIRLFAKKEAASGEEVFRKVVNISSMAGTNGNAGQANYSSAKAALVGLTKTLSKEWGRYKVNVNCVAYGFIDTRLTQSLSRNDAPVKIDGRNFTVGVPEQTLKTLPLMVPLGRAGTPDEAAGAVYLFCIPESNYISGQVLLVGGGINL